MSMRYIVVHRHWQSDRTTICWSLGTVKECIWASTGIRDPWPPAQASQPASTSESSTTRAR